MTTMTELTNTEYRTEVGNKPVTSRGPSGYIKGLQGSKPLHEALTSEGFIDSKTQAKKGMLYQVLYDDSVKESKASDLGFTIGEITRNTPGYNPEGLPAATIHSITEMLKKIAEVGQISLHKEIGQVGESLKKSLPEIAKEVRKEMGITSDMEFRDSGEILRSMHEKFKVRIPDESRLAADAAQRLFDAARESIRRPPDADAMTAAAA
ncbi:hypothetical protein EBR96_05115 [bacterium]|nr:hypothetical protein [bacterium]